MNKNEKEIVTEEGYRLKFRERENIEISLTIPKDVLTSLEKVAARRGFDVHALLKLYIGHELRQDLAKLHSENVLERTREVLSKHIKSTEEVSQIIKEIKTDLAA